MSAQAFLLGCVVTHVGSVLLSVELFLNDLVFIFIYSRTVQSK